MHFNQLLYVSSLDLCSNISLNLQWNIQNVWKWFTAFQCIQSAVIYFIKNLKQVIAANGCLELYQIRISLGMIINKQQCQQRYDIPTKPRIDWMDIQWTCERYKYQIKFK